MPAWTPISTGCRHGSARSARRYASSSHAADPEVEETIKRTVQPYFVLQGNIAALQATKDHVNVFLYDPLLDDPQGVITRGHDAQTGRQIMIFEGEPINRSALLALFKQIVDHNRAGGWRKLRSGGA